MQAAHNLYCWRWAYRCPKHVEIYMIINHNCCIKLVPLIIFIYDARSHIKLHVFSLILFFKLANMFEECFPDTWTNTQHNKYYNTLIIIIMFMKGYVRSLFLNPQSGVGPSISSSVIVCSFVLLVCIVVLVLVFYLCPSSLHVVATFPGIVLFLLLYSVLPFFP